jgi:hypothetical protein
LADCRQPGILFVNLEIAARQYNWKGDKLTLALTLKNISSSPVSIMGAVGNAPVSFPSFNLLNAQGVRYDQGVSGYDQSQLQSQLALMQNINPGITRDFTISFEAPRGPYTLSIGRTVGGGGLLRQEADSYQCTIPS